MILVINFEKMGFSEELESEEQNSNEPIEEAKEQIEINPTFKEFYEEG